MGATCIINVQAEVAKTKDEFEKVKVRAPNSSVYDFNARTADKVNISLQHYRSKVMLIVNIGEGSYAQQAQELENLYKKYRGHGFVVLGFVLPRYQKKFDVKTEEIAKWFKKQYSLTFPLFAKVNENSFGEKDLYHYLEFTDNSTKVEQNWNKFLVDQQGRVVNRYFPDSPPQKIEFDILNLLKGISINENGAKNSVYDFNVVNIDGQNVRLSQYKGKHLLIVNLFERNKWATQVYSLIKLHNFYKKHGLEVLAFFCSEFREKEDALHKLIFTHQLFLHQISKTSKDTDLRRKYYCIEHWFRKAQSSIPFFANVRVSGDQIHPLWKFLRDSYKPNPTEITENWTKFLVNDQGEVINRFKASQTAGYIRTQLPDQFKKVKRKKKTPMGILLAKFVS